MRRKFDFERLFRLTLFGLPFVEFFLTDLLDSGERLFAFSRIGGDCFELLLSTNSVAVTPWGHEDDFNKISKQDSGTDSLNETNVRFFFIFLFAFSETNFLHAISSKCFLIESNVLICPTIFDSLVGKQNGET